MINTRQELVSITIDFVKSIREKGETISNERWANILAYAIAEDILVKADLEWVVRLRTKGVCSCDMCKEMYCDNSCNVSAK